MNINNNFNTQNRTISYNTNITSQENVEKDTKIQSVALDVVRRNLPITTIFTPELQMNLRVFIESQIFFQKIATFLSTFDTKSHIDIETVTKHFANSDILSDIKNILKIGDPGQYLQAFYEVCTDVLGKEPQAKDVTSAIETRAFTFKNALIAIINPIAIRQSQHKNQAKKQDISSIVNEGKNFLYECLRIHLNSQNRSDQSSFKELITDTTTKLIPFVKTITQSYLKERRNIDCPNPLAFRNPTGYNHHGLAAATIMEACLSILGYSTQLKYRSDLEPKINLSTNHAIVVVTSPDGTKYIIDPTYTQFYKDIYADDTQIPTDPVLVLDENKVDEFIDNGLMKHWKDNVKKVESGDEPFEALLLQRDQHVVHSFSKIKLDENKLPAEIIPQNIEEWVRSNLKKLWDVETYRTVRCNTIAEEIFVGCQKSRSTHTSIQPMGIIALNRHIPFENIETSLHELTKKKEKTNEIKMEVLSLLAQIPEDKRAEFFPFFDMNSNITGISPLIYSYLLDIKNEVNPNSKEKRLLSPCSGVDCITPLLATDATDLIFVDIGKFSFTDFQLAIALFNKKNFNYDDYSESIFTNTDFIDFQYKYGGTISNYYKNNNWIDQFELRFIYNLKKIGVKIGKINLYKTQDESNLKFTFPWRYPGASKIKDRSISLFKADITKPAEYPVMLEDEIKNKFNIFYMKAPTVVPLHYDKFLPHLAKSIRKNGWIITTNQTVHMQTVLPNDSLKNCGFNFESKKIEKLAAYNDCMLPPYDPDIIPIYSDKNRIDRTIGVDMQYWMKLEFLQKS